jgi:outer membrane protein OmpA-like peptidoglycan-associated protein
MRQLERKKVHKEEEESVFVTMTDMTISFLLIIMILLAFFATQINENETVSLNEYDRVSNERDDLRLENYYLYSLLSSLRTRLFRLQKENEELKKKIEALMLNPLDDYLSQAIKLRKSILNQLRDGLLKEFPNLQVVISPEQDALRFQGEGLFEKESSKLDNNTREIVTTMGRLLDDVLVCYTLGKRAIRKPDCKSGNALIETVQIEGHTDSDGPDDYNLTLSTKRANETLVVMLNQNQTLLEHKNLRGQPVMAVAAYGEMRPIATNMTKEGKAANRRIDVRIIMYAPSTVEEVEEISHQLDTLRTTALENETFRGG